VVGDQRRDLGGAGRLSTQLTLAAIALGAGFLAGVLVFVPFVALSYRRRGTLEPDRTLLWAGALVYFWAIWAFTLLPMPEPGTIRCAGVNLDLLALRHDISLALARHGLGVGLLTDGVILHLGLNVLLFAPLGFFLRILGHRGVLTAALSGLAVSLFVEVTQLTGVWGLYPCAYRVFDVDDLATNTTGALLGSLLALLVPGLRSLRSSEIDATQPRPVTRTRRALVMVCDLLTLVLVSAAIELLIRAVLLVEESWTGEASLGAALAVLFIVLLWTGRTPGDMAVQLRYAGGPVPAFLARPLRFFGGIGTYGLLGLTGWSGAATVFALLAFGAWVFTAQGRGLPGILSGQELVDHRRLGVGQKV
jgi:hypothetical protein